jgi:hypothetical protein
MPKLSLLGRGLLLRGAATLLVASSLAACGGGGYGGGGGFVGFGVGVQGQGPIVAALDLALTRVGPESIEVDWSDHPLVASFVVSRDGFHLATVTTVTSLIDNTVLVNETYCYQVNGYDAAGVLVAATDTGCITVVP